MRRQGKAADDSHFYGKKQVERFLNPNHARHAGTILPPEELH